MSALDEIDPEGFERRLAQFVEWLRVNHFSEATAEARQKSLRPLAAWCAERGLTRPSEVTRPILEGYQAHLYHYRKSDGQPLAPTSQLNHLAAVKSFFRWLARQNLILSNPASELVLPRLARSLPKVVLSPAEVERVLAVPDVSRPVGLRDRAILETLYSSGLRRMELVALKLYDLDRDAGVIAIRKGKGRRQRVVPIGERAVAWVEKYLSDVRPHHVVPPDEGWLFLSARGGGAIDLDTLTGLVKRYLRGAGIEKPGSAHLFRHSMATSMLEGGADIRFVQEMLGHSKLDTTAVYTHVAIKRLKEVHERTHPAGGTRKPPQDPAPPADGDARPANGSPPATAQEAREAKPASPLAPPTHDDGEDRRSDERAGR